MIAMRATTIISRLRAALQKIRKLLMCEVPDWDAAVDRDTCEMLCGSRCKIVPTDLDFSRIPDAVTCSCCRRAFSASCMDEDGCGICDERLAP